MANTLKIWTGKGPCTCNTKPPCLKSYSHEMTEGLRYLVVFSDIEIQSTQPI